MAGPDLPSLPFSTDMDVDTEDGFGLDIHDAPQEKMDADFFNGALPSLLPPPTHLTPAFRAQNSRTILTTRTWHEHGV